MSMFKFLQKIPLKTSQQDNPLESVPVQSRVSQPRLKPDPDPVG